MKRLFFLFLFISTLCSAQNRFKLLSKIEVAADYFTSDNLGNVYVVKADELIKYDISGKQLYKFSNKNFGSIDFVDASNMLKILVFYKNFSQVVFLDNTLSMSGDPVSLDKLNYPQSQLVCTSHNNGIWIYNAQNFELVRLDQSLQEMQKTGNLSVLLNMEFQPNFLLESNNKIYLNNPPTGLLIFDLFGTYYKSISKKGIKNIQVTGDWVYYTEGGEAKAFNTKTTEEKNFEMPFRDFINFRIENKILIIQNSTSIFIYSEE